MKKQTMLLLPIVVAGAAIISLGGGTTGEKPVDPGLAEMRNEITDLRARIQTLEGRIKSLELTVAQSKRPVPKPLFVPAPGSSLLHPTAPDSKPPKIWGQGEVNGWTYYIVPCGQQDH